MKTTIELFAGAGGLALGVEQAGFEPLGLVEFDKDAADTLKKNRPNWNVIHDDINLIVDKSQLTEVLCLQKWVMEELTRLAFPWLTFNLKAECELSDKSWADKKEYDAHLEYYTKHKDEIGERVKKALNYTYKFEDWN